MVRGENGADSRGFSCNFGVAEDGVALVKTSCSSNLAAVELCSPALFIESSSLLISRIWPEYRWHNLVFVLRSMALIVLFWYEQTYNLERNHFMNLVILMATFAGADLVSWMYGAEHSKTIRDVALPGSYKYFFSAIQLRLQADILYGHGHDSAVHFWTAWVVQSTAFTKTMNRKHLINPKYTAWIYAFQLSAGMLVKIAYRSDLLAHRLLPNVIFFIVCMIRLGPRFLPEIMHSKFVVWPAVYFLVLPHVRPDAEGNLPCCSLEQLQIVTAASLVAWIAFSAWKIRQYPQPENSLVEQTQKTL